MPRPFQPGCVSANHPITGRVIYLTADGNWTGAFGRVEHLPDPRRAATPEVATGTHLALARADGRGRPAPGHLRAAFRAVRPLAEVSVHA